MNEDFLFAVIGKLYVENMNYQRFIPQLQGSLQGKDQEIGMLRTQLTDIEERAKQWSMENENV